MASPGSSTHPPAPSRRPATHHCKSVNRSNIQVMQQSMSLQYEPQHCKSVNRSNILLLHPDALPHNITSLIKNCLLLGPYSKPKPRALRCCSRGVGVVNMSNIQIGNSYVNIHVGPYSTKFLWDHRAILLLHPDALPHNIASRSRQQEQHPNRKFICQHSRILLLHPHALPQNITSLIRDCLLLGPYSRPKPRALGAAKGGSEVSTGAPSKSDVHKSKFT